MARRRTLPSVALGCIALGILAAVAPAQIRPAPPWIVAHRGASQEQPENTLPAFRRALELGAQWLECDVFTTADGELVVIHDPSTGRTCDRILPVGDSSLAELRALDASLGFRNAHSLDTDRCPPTEIPTLRELLDLVRSDPRARLTIQPKDDSVAAAAALVKDSGLVDRIAFNDGDLDKLTTARRLLPGATILWDRPADADLAKDAALAKDRGFTALIVHHRAATLEGLASIRSAGLECGVWTVNDPRALAECLARGAQWIYTDAVAEAVKLRDRQLARDRVVMQQREALDLPALAVGILEHGRPTYAAVFGELGPRRGDPLTTRFRIASITKTFTGLLLDTLAAEGVVALDDPVAKHLPPDAALPDECRTVTLTELATHTSGLPRMVPLHGKPGDPYGAPDLDDLLDGLADIRARSEPGERYDYSNLGFALLGLALERAAGVDYAELLQAKVLTPMGLTRTEILDPAPDDPSVARGFQGASPTDEQVPWALGRFAPAGGVAATLPDLCRYAQLHLDAVHDRPLPDGLSAEVLRTVQDERFAIPPQRGAGLGWARVTLGDGTLRVWHNGAVGGFRSLLVMEPDRDRAVVILMNRGFAAGADPCESVVAAVFTRLRDEAAAAQDGR